MLEESRAALLKEVGPVAPLPRCDSPDSCSSGWDRQLSWCYALFSVGQYRTTEEEQILHAWQSKVRAGSAVF